MKTVKNLKENGIYLITGKAVAKNAFFENRIDVELAHRYIVRYLTGMMEVQDYLFTPEGWMLIVKTKSVEKISSTYLDLRSRSKKAKEAHIKTKASEMLSEHIRFFLSKLVRTMNERNNRTGTKVHRVFERFIFDSYEECADCMDRMRREALNMCNQTSRYKADKLDYTELEKIVGTGDVILCSKVLEREVFGVDLDCEIVELQRVTNDVLGKLIFSTYTQEINKTLHKYHSTNINTS